LALKRLEPRLQTIAQMETRYYHRVVGVTCVVLPVLLRYLNSDHLFTVNQSLCYGSATIKMQNLTAGTYGLNNVFSFSEIKIVFLGVPPSFKIYWKRQYLIYLPSR
jgi:hypothetical protein